MHLILCDTGIKLLTSPLEILLDIVRLRLIRTELNYFINNWLESFHRKSPGEVVVRARFHTERREIEWRDGFHGIQSDSECTHP